MGITEKIAKPYYLEWLDLWKYKDIIKVVSGIRRAGKTTLLELFREKLAEIGIVKENIIYLELARRYRNVYVGMMGKQEVDFVALTNGEPHYYQVALSVRDENTLARELAPLEAIRDHHPKTLLTLDPDPPFSHNGIRQINVIDFLLSPV